MSTPDRIAAALEAHAHETPDPREVLRASEELARGYRRRRTAAAALSCTVLGVGVVAGAANLPSLLRDEPSSTVGTFAAPPAPEKTYSQEEKLQEFFLEGYDITNAQELAVLWAMPDLTQVKTEAGDRLLHDQALPVQPNGEAAPPEDAAQTRSVNAYFGAGYDYEDAVRLAELWHTDDAFAAKVLGGEKIQNGEELPFPATP